MQEQQPWLARPEDTGTLFAEMHRVLRRSGRAVISDIVCDEDPTPSILADPDLWSGCIAGAGGQGHGNTHIHNCGYFGCDEAILNSRVCLHRRTGIACKPDLAMAVTVLMRSLGWRSG